jgi:hypothetical protein
LHLAHFSFSDHLDRNIYKIANDRFDITPDITDLRELRRAISVLPTPVGPIMRIFFGVTSSRSSALSFMRRHRLRNAIATARFAAD